MTRRRDPGSDTEGDDRKLPEVMYSRRSGTLALSTGTPASGEARIRDCRYPRDHGFTDFCSDAFAAIAAVVLLSRGPSASKQEGSLHYGPGELSTGFGDPSTIGFGPNSPRAEFD